MVSGVSPCKSLLSRSSIDGSTSAASRSRSSILYHGSVDPPSSGCLFAEAALPQPSANDFFDAVRTGNLFVAQQWAAQCPTFFDLDVPDTHKGPAPWLTTALDLAVFRGQLEVAQWLATERPSFLDKVTEGGCTLLHTAVLGSTAIVGNYHEVVKWVVAQRPALLNVNLKEFGTPYDWAKRLSLCAIAETLLASAAAATPLPAPLQPLL